MEKLLTEVCNIQYGYPFDSSKFSETEGVPLIRIRDVTRGYSETFTTEEYKSEYLVYSGDLLIGMDGEFNIARWGEIPALLNQRVCRLIPSKAIDKGYLYYYMPTALKEIEAKTPFVTVKHLSAKELNKIKIPLPPLDEQRKIAAVLDKVSDLIAKRRQQLDKLDELIKARFVEIFGDMVNNPKAWDTYSLDDCFEITSSKRILKSEWKDSGIPFLRVRDMVQLATTGKVDNEFFISEEFYASLSDSDGIPKEGDILVSATSTLGKCYVVGKGERFYFKDADVLRLRAKKEINPIFFIEQMKTGYIEEQISKTLGVTTVAHFTIKAAKIINMRCPNIELQNQFAAFVEQTEKTKTAISKSLEKLETLKKALMQKYFG